MARSEVPPDFPVVALGASAGGLDAFKTFLELIPADSGMAFVLLQHLDPRRESQLAELLAPQTSMGMVQARNNLRIEPNHVYVIPPDAAMTVEEGRLRLKAIGARMPRMPIDIFLRSLATDCGDRAIGVVLTGTGTDGTLGLKEIKDKDGLAIAQDPDDAAYDGMPRSAIASGVVDLILPLREIPNALVGFAQQKGSLSTPALAERVRNDLDKIIEFLRQATSHNFTHYKPGTLQRRIERRMAITHAATSADYLSLLKRDQAETNMLAKDLLIGVTSFFRDAETYDFLEQNVLGQLIRERAGERPLRVWVPGCSTGEEAYSLAMMLIEQVSTAKLSCKIQVFASDVNETALEIARRGVYPESIQADVSRARLDRFFTPIDHTYKVVSEVRETIVFAVQNLLTDPPFSNVDLISCRNVLIYLKPEIQEQVFGLFHFALRDNGILVLGSSETIGTQTERFVPVARRVRVYRRTGGRRPLEFQYGLLGDGMRVLGGPGEARQRRPRVAFGELARQRLLDLFAPAAVLINANYQGLYYYGPIDGYLMVPAGEAGQDVMSMAREGLRSKLRGVVHDAISSNAPAVASGVRMSRDSRQILVTVAANPVDLDGDRLALVSFRDEPRPRRRRAVQEPDTTSQDAIKGLEQELEATRHELQGTVRDLEISNEELRASNEEAMSLNEEFRLTNEELETSKEELQSLNEELSAVNRELQENAEEQRRTASHLSDILNSSQIVMLFLDAELRIEFFTPNARNLFNIISTDIGRPISSFTRSFSDEELLPDAEAVLRSGVPVRREIEAEDGTWYLRQVLPYRGEANHGKGVIITFTNILEIKKAERQLVSTKAYLQNIVDTVRGPLLVLDADLKVISASRSYYRDFRTSADATEGRQLYDLADGAWDSTTLRRLLRQILPEKTTVENFELQLDIPGRGRRVMLLDARGLVGPEAERAPLILLAMEDITERRRAVDEQFQAFLDASPDAAVVVNPDCEIQFVNQQAAKLFGYPQEALIRRSVEMLMPERFREHHLEHQKAYFASPSARPMGTGLEVVGLAMNGNEIPFEVSLSPVEIGGRKLAVAMVRDVTERRKAEQALQESERRFREFMEHAQLICVTLDRDGTIQFCNEHLLTLTGWQRRDVEGKDWFDLFIPPDDRNRIRDVFSRSMKAGEIVIPANFENAILTKAGERRLVAWNNALLHDGAGEVVGATSLGSDVTKQRLAQEALEAAKTEAEQANALKSRFLAATSHDLRQPLQTLGLLQGVLSRTVRDESSRSVVQNLGETIASMASTIDALLDINQLESGAIQPERMDFPVSSVLTRMRSEYARVAEAKGLQLRVVSCSATIHSDPGLLERLVGNLVSNAIKYTEDGKVLVGCRRRVDKLRIEVRDTGIGIPDDQLAEIFEEYYQLDNPARERTRGLGLGLTVVRRMAELLRHRIDVRSTLGRGSMFAVEVSLGHSRAEDADGEAPSAATSKGDRISVLLVEDDLAVRESLGLFLSLQGYDVTTAATANEALAQLAEGSVQPRILIADRNLPGGISGVELVGRLRAQMDEEIPGLVLTGDASLETMREIIESGAVYLRKPADAGKLLELIQQLVGEHQEPYEAQLAAVEAGAIKAPAEQPRGPVVSVVDDDPPVRDAIRVLLEASGYEVETFSTCEAFLARARPERSACLLVDVGMPGMDGLDLQERLKADGVDIPVIVMSGRRDVPLAVQAMRAGAVDFLQKPFNDETLLEAIERALARATQSADRAEAARRLERLTPREREVLGLIVAGCGSKEVAARLGISPRTAENHRRHIYEKTSTGSLAELVRLAIAVGLGLDVPTAQRST